MERNKLCEEEKARIKKAIDILSSFVMNEIKLRSSLINKDSRTKERVAELAANMKSAFYWEGTAEGNEYWADIHRRLERIAKAGF